MWDPSLYQKAIKFAGVAHSQQLVPGTEANYLLHLSNVAMEILLAYNASPSFDVNFAVTVALLHDTLEDTDVKKQMLAETFGQLVADGVWALTKNLALPKRDRMQDSLQRILTQPKEVAMVKLADRITNLQPPPPSWPKAKVLVYSEEATLILHALGKANSHLSKRLEKLITTYPV